MQRRWVVLVSLFYKLLYVIGGSEDSQGDGDQECVVKAGGADWSAVRQVSGRVWESRITEETGSCSGGYVRSWSITENRRQKTRTLLKEIQSIEMQVTQEQPRCYQHSWLNNLAMCVWRTGALILRVMSWLQAGETRDQVQPLREAVPTLNHW